MVNVQIEETSGFSILDNAAVLIARNTKLSEPPRTTDGQPTTAQTLADAIWTLPLVSADEYLNKEIYDGPLPRLEDSVTVPLPDPDRPNRVGARDYPVVSIRLRQMGRVGVYVLIGEDGTVRDARLGSSSGYEALDRGTVVIAKRFYYLPGTINGVASEMWVPQQVQWLLSSSGTRTIHIDPCYSAPLIDPFERRQSVAEGEALPKIDRWTLVRRNGDIDEGLILTEQGWKKLAQPLIDVMNEQPGPAEDEGRRETCWFYDSLNPMMME